MAIMVRDTGGNFEPAPEGMCQSVCVDVVDLPKQQTGFGIKDMVQLTWQTEPLRNDKTGKDERFLVFRRFNASLNEKSALYKTLVAWRGRKFTVQELAGFDLEKLIGVNCQLQIVHNIVDGSKVYANVQAVVPLGRTANKIEAVGFVRKRDRVVKDQGYGETPPHSDSDAPQGDDDGPDPDLSF